VSVLDQLKMLERVFCVRFWKGVSCKIDDICTKWCILIYVGKKIMEY
jgi:hypothetical protein